MIWSSCVYFSLLLSSVVSQPEQTSKKLKCLPAVKRFSKGGSQTEYYECSKHGDLQVKTCPTDLFYHTKTQRCVSRQENEKLQPIDDKALGRNIALGAMYDARRSMFIPDASLWTYERIKQESFVYNRSNTNLGVTTFKRTKDKTDFFDIQAGMSLDIMSGMVELSGSGRYMKNDVTHQDEAYVELNYQTTRYTETLPKYTEKNFFKECSNPDITHVVTSVTYGLNAIFVFSKTIESHETDDMVTGDMKLAINKIPTASVEGEAGVNITNSDHEYMETVSLNIFGDFLPTQPLPTTFDQAVEFYRDIAVFAADSSAPIEVHLTPISDICSEEDRMLNDLSDDVLTAVIKMMDELEELEMKVNGLLNSKQAQKFPPVRENLSLYRKALSLFMLDRKLDLLKILPSIRGGNVTGEDELMIMLNLYLESPFEFSLSWDFLVDRNREIQAIRFLEENFPIETNMNTADYESANDVQYIFERDQVIILEFNILTSKELTQSFLDGNPIDESNFWYNDVSMNGEVGEVMRNVSQFGLANVDEESKGYLVKVSPIKTDLPYTENAMVQGKLLSTKYRVPGTPDLLAIFDVSHNSFSVSAEKSNRFVTGLRIHLTNILLDESHHQDFVFIEDRQDFLVGGLMSSNVYVLRTQYLTEVGVGPMSEPSLPFAISATSRVQKLAVSEVETDYITLVWEPPAVIAEGLSQQDLQYKVLIRDENNVTEESLTMSTSWTLHKPLDASEYNFEVDIYLNRLLIASQLEDLSYGTFDNFTMLNFELEDHSKVSAASVKAISKPTPPTLLTPLESEIGDTTAKISWLPSSKLAQGAVVNYYELEYSIMNENGDETYSGTSSTILIDETSITVENLMPGTVYNFKTKVYTSEGDSDFSIGIIFMTKYNADDFDSMRKDIDSHIEGTATSAATHESICGFSATVTAAGTVTFDMIHINSNMGNLDINTGKYTVAKAGTYKVSYGAELMSSPGQEQTLTLQLNGNELSWSKVAHQLDGFNFGSSGDYGGREALVYLEPGAEMWLEYKTNTGPGATNILFCLSAVMFD